MKKVHTIALGVLGLLVSASAIANSLSTNAELVTSVEVRSNNDQANLTITYVSFAITPNTRATCQVNSTGVLVGSPDNVRAMTSLATSAFLAGKKLRPTWDGGCYGPNFRIINLQME